jgi:hypothetical protein
MSCREWIDADGSLYKEWTNKAGHLHRQDGPAQISYYPDCSIEWESFYIDGKFFGYDKKGFWAFWDQLTEVERQAPDIIKCLARYS